MKTAKHWIKRSFLFTTLLLWLAVFPATASAGETYNLKLNEEKTIYLFHAGLGSITSSRWSSSDGRIVKIKDSSLMSCTVVGVDNTYGTTATITCRYNYRLAGSVFSAVETYKVTVPEEPDSEESESFERDCALSVQPSSVTLDMAGENRQRIDVEVVGRPPLLWGVTPEYSADGCVRVMSGDQRENKRIYYFAGEKIGSQNITIRLYSKETGEEVTLDSVKIPVKVRCSHVYDGGKVTKQPTDTAEGERLYTCQFCGGEKTEVLPVREPETSPEETESEEFVPETTEVAESIPEPTEPEESAPDPTESEKTEPSTKEETESWGPIQEETVPDSSDDFSEDWDYSDEDAEDDEPEDEEEDREYEEEEPERTSRRKPWEREKSYDLSEADLSIRTRTIEYTGREVKPRIAVRMNGRLLTSACYDVAYYDNIEVGTATAVIEGSGDYYGSQTITFPIEKAEPDIRGMNRFRKRSRDEDWSFSLRARGEEGVPLSYVCDDSRLRVDADGTVYVPGGYEGTAKVEISAPETASYKAKTKTVTVMIR